jgi:hypothetical protein
MVNRITIVFLSLLATTGAAELQWQHMTLNGLLEIEAGYENDFETEETSDLTIATVELGLNAQIHPQAEAYLSVKYEENETPLEIDEARLTVHQASQAGTVVLAIGQQYAPFGRFETQLVSDPLTLALAEIREKTLQLGLETASFYSTVYAFNGETQEDANDTIDHWGLDMGLRQENSKYVYEIGLGYLNGIGDTDGLTDALESTAVNGYVGGLNLHAWLELDDFYGIVEYIRALDAFDERDLAFGAAGAQPQAWHLELSYALSWLNRETTLALSYQATEEALALGLPETRYLMGISMALFEQMQLSLEWAFDQDYDKNVGGTGHDADILTLQLAVEF